MLEGAGIWLSTGRDLLKYVEAHLGEPAGPLAGAIRLAIAKRRPSDDPATSIGLAWHITAENALDIVWHNGAAGGSCGYVGFLEQAPVGVVVLSNSNNSVDELGRTVLYLLQRY